MQMGEDVADTKNGDDGVRISTPRSHSEVDGALSADILIVAVNSYLAMTNNLIA